MRGRGAAQTWGWHLRAAPPLPFRIIRAPCEDETLSCPLGGTTCRVQTSGTFAGPTPSRLSSRGPELGSHEQGSWRSDPAWATQPREASGSGEWQPCRVEAATPAVCSLTAEFASGSGLAVTAHTARRVVAAAPGVDEEALLDLRDQAQRCTDLTRRSRREFVHSFMVSPNILPVWYIPGTVPDPTGTAVSGAAVLYLLAFSVHRDGHTISSHGELQYVTGSPSELAWGTGRDFPEHLAFAVTLVE